ncbi:MAG: efflux RND transporter permease subunit [Oscillospiraceae bacterium]|nr:efflux RND transporter permease subunit [Oscillospiraceae bacterium]
MTKYSIKKPFTVLVAVVLVLVLGVVSFTKLKTDLLPKMDLPYVVVMTTAPGASPERVETTVTKPLESVLATTSGLENLQSISMENVSVIIMEFSGSVNMDSAMIEMSSSIDLVEGYFEDTVSAPMLMKLNPDMLPIQVLSVDMDGMDIKELSKFIENDISPYLERIDGVATVDTVGLVADYIDIKLNQEKIDKVNDELLYHVDRELYDAKKELDDAKKELDDAKQDIIDGKEDFEDGKDDLEDGIEEMKKAKDEAFEALAQGTVQLEEGKSQLEAVTGQVTQLNAEKALIDGLVQGADKVKEIVKGLEDMKAGLEKDLADTQNGIGGVIAALPSFGIDVNGDTPFGQIISAIDGVIGALDAQADAAAIASLEGMKTAFLPNAEDGIDENTTYNKLINDINSGLDGVKNGIEGAYSGYADSLEAAGMAPETVAKARAKDLDGVKADLGVKGEEVGRELKTAETLKGQVSASLDMLKAQQAQLEKQKMEAVTQLAVLESQLTAADGQMDAAEDQLDAAEEQIDEAYEQIEEGYEQFYEARDKALHDANIDSLVTQSMISNILTAQNFSMPAGYIMLDGEKMTVKVGEKFSDANSLENLMLVDMGIEGMKPVYLCDVADVTVKDNSNQSFVKVNGNNGIVMSFNKSSVASTSEVSKEVTKVVKELEEKHEGLHITTLMDQGDYIGMIVDSVLSNLVYGGLIALLVLIIFLKSARPTLIIGMSIPLSVLIALVAMYFTDVTLNIISLSGLALAVGMLVDNSIVVIENIYRLRGLGYPTVKAAVTGTKQVGGAIAASTLTTICVFLPIVFTEGLTRQIFTDMGLTIGYVLVASLLVALTFVPCLSTKILGNSHETTPKFMDKLTALYEKALRANLKHKWFVIIVSVVLLAVSVVNALSMPMAFIPAMDGPQMSMTLTMDGSISDQELYDAGWDIAQKTQTIQDVDTVAVLSGGTSVASMTSSAGEDSKSLSFYVVLNKDRTLSNRDVAALIEAEFPQYEDELTVTAESMDMSALGGTGFSVAIKGNDFDRLGEISADLAAELEKIEGVKSTDDGSGSRSRELRIEVDKNAAMKEGLTTAQVFQMINEKLTDETATTTFTFDGSDLDGYITATVQYDGANIGDMVVVDKIDEDNKLHLLTLSDIATITTAESPQAIVRDNQSRTYTVSARFEDGVNTTLVARQLEKVVENFNMPDGYQFVVSGENTMVMEAMADMALMILLAIVFIYLIMVAQFQSLRSPFIVLFTIPLAFTGGLLALQLTGTVLSIVSMIGFLVLTGVVVNNGIVFIDYVNQLRAEGMEMYDALVQTGCDRIRPILMTALTTILAMSTMAFGVGMGAEMSQGMAIVSIGGLAYATLLTLFLVPGLYALFHKKPLKVIDVDFEEE